ncbi:unnamed protein product [Musa acuminata subsp. burmannicoides]
MALIAHHTQGSFSTHSLSCSASSRRANVRSSIVQLLCIKHVFVPLKHHFHFSYAYIHELRKRCKEMERKKTDGGVATEEKSSKGRVHPSDTPSPVCREERGEGNCWRSSVTK